MKSFVSFSLNKHILMANYENSHINAKFTINSLFSAAIGTFQPLCNVIS